MSFKSKFLAAVAAVMLAMGLCPALALAADSGLQAGSAVFDDLATQATPAEKIMRLAGENAYGTMVKAVSEGWESSDTVVVATFGGYWDALAASALAGSEQAPVLLTDAATLSPETKSLIEKLGAKKAYICGGPAVVSPAVEASIKGMGLDVIRKYGDNAFLTAEAVSAEAKANLGAKCDTCVVATINGFYDSLSMAPASYALGMPIYLTNTEGVLADSTVSAIKAAGYSKAIIVGGEAAVRPEVVDQLKSAGISGGSDEAAVRSAADDGAIKRLGGANAWETSELIAEWGLENGIKADTVGVACGNGYWDALTGAPLVGLKGGALVLVPYTGPTFDNQDWMQYDPFCIQHFIADNAKDVDQVYIFGGEVVITPEAEADIVKALTIEEPASIELETINNTLMFKAVTASAAKNDDGSVTLTMALNGTGYHYLYKGTFEQAVANGEAVENWIAGEQNAEGKWEFKIPVAADELGTDVPVVAVSDREYNNHVANPDQTPMARAFYPRQLNVDLEKATLTTGDYESTKDIAVTNNVSMFRPAAAATLEIVGGPNSNNYKADLVLPMTTASMSDAFVGTPAEAEKAEKTIAFDASTATDSQAGTFTIPVKWVAEFGKPDTLVSLAGGEPFVISFKSASNGNWYGRQATLDEAAGTLVFDPWTEPAPGNTVDELIAKIQVQQYTDTTWADCEAAKAAWDALSDEEKELVEEYDYFGLDTGDASKDDPLNADEIGENEILVVSFGTSFNDSRVATIGGVEKAIAKAYPDWSVRRAFTAQIIINHIYARDGEKIDNVTQAMDRAVANGVKNLVVQPTHLMHGAEYDELKDEIDKYADKMSITYAEPLLGEVGADATVINADKEAVAKAVVAEANVPEGTALVLMGHGTEHVANVTYEQMQTVMDKLGYNNVFVGTVEGLPESTECSNVIAKVKAAGFEKVVLRPLMVVAGDHANNDMADPEDEESWYSQFTAEGNFAADNVTCQIAGLGEIEAIQQIYVDHVAAALAGPVEPVVLEDGTYKLSGLAAGPSAMFDHMIAEESFLKVEGDSATIIFTEDGSTASVGKYSRLALGKSSELLPAEGNYFADTVLPEGTVIVEGENAGAGELGTKWHFEVPVTKAEAEALFNEPDGKLYVTVYNNTGTSADKIPGWYKASNDIYLTLGELGEKVDAPEVTELADGTYKIPGLSTQVVNMYHFDADAARVVVKGDEAWLITSIDGTAEASTLKRFVGMAYGPQSKILDAADDTNHTLVEGTPVATVTETKDDAGTVVGRTFVLPVDKDVLVENGDIFYMMKYSDGYSATHDGDWYKANGGDYYLDGYTLEYENDSTSLPGLS